MNEYLEVERRSSLVLLPGIVDRPGRTLAEVMAHPRWRWVLPAVLCIAAVVFVTLVSAPYLAEQAQQQSAMALQRVESQLGDMTDAQREQIRQQMTLFSGPLVVAGIALVNGIVGLFVGWIISSAILFFGLQIGGREVRFGQVFSGFSWTWLPFALRDLLNGILILVTGKLITNPGLSYFFASGDPLADAGNPLWNLAGKIDLFFLWHLVLVFFLVRSTSKRGGGLVLTLIYTVLILALRIIPTVLASAFSFGP